jgi:hypothetical protein
MDLSSLGVRATAGTLRAVEGVVLHHAWTEGGVVTSPAGNGAQLLHLSVALCVLSDPLLRVGRRPGHPDAGFTVATKIGRRLEQVPSNCVEANFRQWLDCSRQNLGVDTIDMVQLHCPPSEVIDDDATYDVLDRLVDGRW